MSTQSFENFAVGDYVVFERAFSPADFAAFSALSGDKNPLHHDAAYAAASEFGGAIAPLHLTLAPLSMIAGMVFPGEPSLYLGHEVRAMRPVRYGETIRYSARIEKINAAHRVLGLRVLALSGTDLVLDATMRVQARVPEWETLPPLPVIKASQPALAVVTGAAGEIGSAIACVLAAKGWRLLLQDRGKKDSRKSVEDRLAALGAKADFVVADLATVKGRETLASAVAAQENIGLVVHAASPPVNAPVEDLVAVNFSACKALIEASLPAMLLRQGAAFVFISSIATERNLPGWEAYSGAKAMTAGLVNGIEQKYAAHGVRGHILLPGLVATKFSEPYRGDSPALLPQEVAEAVLRITGDDTSDNALVIEAGRESRGRIGFHLPGAERPPASAGSQAAPAADASARAMGSPAAATLRKVLRLGAGVDLSAAELGVTPGWDSLRHLELLLEIESALGIRFSSGEMAATQRFADLDALCRKKLNS